ncbi:hypothetical protein E4L95_17435, partial [Paracoccus liaowanqingii]
MSDPWFKFFPTDWRADPALRMCSLAARGLWIEMIALMHDAVPYGHLLISDQPPTDAQLAVLGGAPTDQITNSLGELELAGVFSRTRKGVIYSRRMVRDGQGRAIAMKNGKKGGNPTLRKAIENMPLDNPLVKERVKPQKPEARSQIDDGGGDTREADTLRGRILSAIGVDPISGMAGPNGNLLGTKADMERVRMWQADLGLNSDTIIAVVVETMTRKRDGPPSRLTYGHLEKLPDPSCCAMSEGDRRLGF